MSAFDNATLMITGGTGSFGSTVLKHFLDSDLKEIRIFSRDEKKQDDMRHELQAKHPENAKKVKHYSEKNVVALCVAMHLPPWLSFKLIEKAGFALAETEEQQAFMTVLTCMFMRSVDEVDEYLKVRGSEPLGQVAA